MKLDRLILVNWGQLQPGDYPMGNMTLLTGPTGAGKSTLLDSLQTIMTAAYHGIVAYNPGQEEVQAGQRRGKSKRTLESFVAGAEYSRFSRPAGAHGYIGAVFRPDPDEPDAKTFTALVAAAARTEGQGDRREARLERLVLIIVEDAALTHGDFFADRDAGLCHPVDEIVKRLKLRYPKVISFDDRKRDYLCGLYGRFRGRTVLPWDEAQHAARAWSQSIAYRPIGSVHDLVRDDILDFDAKQLQESITRIGDLMRQVTNLKHEGRRLEDSVNRLRALKSGIDAAASAFEDQVRYDLLAARLRVAGDDARIAAERRKIKDDTALIKRLEQKAHAAAQRKGATDTGRIELAGRLAGISAHAEKKALDERLARATASARATLTALHDGLIGAAQLANVADALNQRLAAEPLTRARAACAAVSRALQAVDSDRLAGLREAVQQAHDAPDLADAPLQNLASAFDGIEDHFGALHAALAGTEDSVLLALAADEAHLAARLDAARKTRRELAERKEHLAAGGGNYPRDTQAALERLRERLPEAGVQVLCDLVEPVSEQWQVAIEGYLDGARFNLIVQPEWEARTVDLLKASGSRARVVQGQRCLERADATRVPAKSIIHELRTDHPIANAYLIEQFGNVVKVPNTEALRGTPRGLTQDGKGSGAMTMFVTERRELVLGRKARDQALADIGVRLEAAECEVATQEHLHEVVGSLRRQLANLRAPHFDAAPLAGLVTELQAVRQALTRLDLTEVEQLRAELARLEAQIAEHDSTIAAARREIVLAEQRLADAERGITDINAMRDARFAEREAQIARLKQLCEANPEKTYTVMAQEVDDLLTAGTLDLAAVQARQNDLRARPGTLLGDVRELLAEYNAAVRPDERFAAALPHFPDVTRFDPNYGPLVMLGRAVRDLHNELEGIGLYHNRAKVEEAERSFHDVFTKQFCVEIKSKVDEGVRTLRQLNFELERLKFGTDRFSIDWSKWEPEYQDYYGFFAAVAELADSPDTVDLFGATELSAKHIEVRDRLVRLLLDPDQDRAGRELLRIADYRNYRRYEIWNDSDSGGRIALSTWGTGSGGQLETPAYIVRAAVVTNRLKLFEKEASLKLLVSDESFSKMDEARARAVLGYLRDSLGLQIISAMPTRNAGGLRPEFDREYSFSRVSVPVNGELDFVLECDERIFRPDRMRALWEAQRTALREQARLAFESAEGTHDAAPP